MRGAQRSSLRTTLKKKRWRKKRQRRRLRGGGEKSNLFMIHHIDSPRQLLKWRLGNIAVCFICYSVLRWSCGSPAACFVVSSPRLRSCADERRSRTATIIPNRQSGPEPSARLRLRLLAICDRMQLGNAEEDWSPTKKPNISDHPRLLARKKMLISR